MIGLGAETRGPDQDGGRRTPWLPTVIAVLVLLGLGWGVLHLSSRPADPDSRAPTETDEATTTTSAAAIQTSAGDATAGSPPPGDSPWWGDEPFRGPCTVSGVVVDTDGKPVAGAWIETLLTGFAPGEEPDVDGNWLAEWQEEELRSDADGRFEFTLDSHCPNGVAAIGGSHRRGTCSINSPEKGPVECMIVVRQAWFARGAVVDRAGQPVEGARVSATTTADLAQWWAITDRERAEVEFDPGALDLWGRWSQHDYSDGDGDFEVGPLARGDWWLLVEQHGFERTTVKIEAAELERGSTTQVTLQPVDCWVVEVIDDDGRPVEGAEIVASPIVTRENLGFHEDHTDRNGESEICSIAGPNAHVWVTPRVHAEAESFNRDGRARVVVEVKPAGSIVGTLEMAPVGRVWNSMVHTANCFGDDEIECTYVGHVDCEPGRFRLDHVPEGSHVFRVGCGDGTAVIEATVRAGEVTDVGAIEVTR